MGIFSRSNRHKPQGGLFETPDGFGVSNKEEALNALDFMRS